MTTNELRQALLAEHQEKLEGRAQAIKVQRQPNEFENALDRVLEKAKEDGVALPEDRETVEQNIQAADEMSGVAAYAGQTLDAGDSLLTSDEAPTVTIDLASAIRKAIEHNLDLRVARLNPQISELQIEQAEAVFDGVLFADANFADLDTPQPPGTIPGISGDTQSNTRTLSTGIRKDLSTGGRITAQADLNRSQQTPSFFGVNRFYESDLLLQLEQPLLRGFGSDVAEANIQLAGIANQADRAALEQTMIELANAIEQTYWQLVAARSLLQVQQRLYERTIAMRDKLEPRFGFDLLLADLNEVNARVDQRYADVLRAQQSVRTLSDQLKRLMNDPDLPVIDETLLEPSDAPSEEAITFSLLDQVTTALKERPEIETALLAIDDADVRRVVADNAELPILNLVASANANGLDVNDAGDALGNALDFDYIDYALGVQFERPWGNRSAEALFEQRTLERQRALENYRSEAQLVTLEVKDALRSVGTNYQLIDTTRSQRRASALSLEVAAIQLDKGGRNEAETFTTRVDRVLARQDALAQAELAEVQALSDYMIAVSELRRATGTSLKQAGVEETIEQMLALAKDYAWWKLIDGYYGEEKITHSIFIAGPNFTGIMGEDGKPEWTAPQKKARDGYVLENGNILIAWANEVKEFDKDKQVVWSYQLDPANKEIGTAQRLPNGDTLIAELGAKPRLIEVSPEGEIKVEVKLQPEGDNIHLQTRMARKLDNGNYLVPHLLAFAVMEYTPEGEIVKTFATDTEHFGGREARNWPFTAIRTPEGTTVVGCTVGNRVVEFDKDGKVIWEITNKDVGGLINDACGVQRLPNGNTVVTSYRSKKGVKMFEVNKEKQVVWKYDGPFRAHHFQVLTTNGEPVSDTTMK
eukprot:g12940.t1